MLRCADGTLYSGYAADLEGRIRTHNAGKGAKYTRSRLPVVLAYSESFPDKSSAMRRECAFKRLSRTEKEAMIESAKTASER
ncbi:MAG: GIY-YIG nuclease family protein [Clostridiales bacterium]|nr:GIY-YIG nuclease family protein [Clostridiales bacterium]